MSTFFDDMVKDLTDAIRIESGELELEKVAGMQIDTYRVKDVKQQEEEKAVV